MTNRAEDKMNYMYAHWKGKSTPCRPSISNSSREIHIAIIPLLMDRRKDVSNYKEGSLLRKHIVILVQDKSKE